MRKNKIFGLFETLVTLTLTVLLLLGASGAGAQAAVEEKLVRLHVVAHSDAAADQAVKLTVRDVVLDVVEDLCGGAQDAAEAAAAIAQNLDEIEHAARKALQDAGFTYGAQANLDEKPFPVRDYISFSLPSGIYTALTVTLGDGEGQNWWCVVFPALCGAQDLAAAADAGLSDSDIRFIRTEGGIDIRFRIVEWYNRIADWFSKR